MSILPSEEVEAWKSESWHWDYPFANIQTTHTGVIERTRESIQFYSWGFFNQHKFLVYFNMIINTTWLIHFFLEQLFTFWPVFRMWKINAGSSLAICWVCYFVFQITEGREQDKHLEKTLFLIMITAFKSSGTRLLNLSYFRTFHVATHRLSCWLQPRILLSEIPIVYSL